MVKPHKNPTSFAKGRRKTGGRKAGTLNKTTRSFKEAFIIAAENIGADGRGREGLAGFLEAVGRKDYKTFCSILVRLIPLQVTGRGGGPIQIVTRSIEEIEKDMRERGITVNGKVLEVKKL